MSTKNISILFLILVILGGYVCFFEIEWSETEKKTPEIEKLFDINPDDVNEILLKRKDQTLLFRLEGSQWMVKEPIEAKANNERVSQLLEVLAYGIVRVIEEAPTDIRQFGLSEPYLELGLKVKGENEFNAFVIGDNSPGGISCYGRVKGKDRVLLLGIRYKMDLDHDVTHFTS